MDDYPETEQELYLRATADISVYLLFEQLFCDCEDLCVCGWDD